MHPDSTPFTGESLPLSGRQKALIRQEIAVDTSGFGDIGLAFSNGHRAEVMHYLKRLGQFVGTLDLIGWSTHDEPTGELSQSIRTVSYWECQELYQSIEESADKDTALAMRDTMDAWQALLDMCNLKYEDAPLQEMEA